MPSPLRCFTLLLAALIPAVAVARSAPDPADRPMRIVQTRPAEYPITGDTLHLPTGRARIVILVTAEGRLEDTMIVSYSHQAFAKAALDALAGWNFEPARRNGEPIAARREVAFEFEPSKAIVNVVEIDQVLRTLERNFPWRETRCVASPHELDRPLAVVPAATAPAPVKVPDFGTAVLDYYVDAEGRPRMPVLIRADSDALAAAAHASLNTAQFSPPTTRGRKTAVRVRQEFRFGTGS